MWQNAMASCQETFSTGRLGLPPNSLGVAFSVLRISGHDGFVLGLGNLMFPQIKALRN